MMDGPGPEGRSREDRGFPGLTADALSALATASGCLCGVGHGCCISCFFRCLLDFSLSLSPEAKGWKVENAADGQTEHE